MKRILSILPVAILVTIGVIFAINLVCAKQISMSKVIAYYFHGSSRCPTCHKLEQYSKEAVKTNFKDALSAGKLEFKVVNMEESGKQYYANRYGLYSQALILSLVKDGKEEGWENLDKIWEYVGNKEVFISYVKDKVSGLLKEIQ